MDYSNHPRRFDFEMDNQFDNVLDEIRVEIEEESNDNFDINPPDVFHLFRHYMLDLLHSSNSQTLPDINTEILFDSYFMNDIPDFINSFVHFMHVGSDPLLEQNIREQRDRLTDFITQSPFLNAIYTDVMDASFNEPPPKKPVPDNVFKLLPIVKIDQKLIDLNESCVICTESFSLNENVLLLSCNHAYHQDCIRKWFQEQNMCPICRKKVSEDQSDINSSDQFNTLNSNEENLSNMSNSNNSEDLYDDTLFEMSEYVYDTFQNCLHDLV